MKKQSFCSSILQRLKQPFKHYQNLSFVKTQKMMQISLLWPSLTQVFNIFFPFGICTLIILMVYTGTINQTFYDNYFDYYCVLGIIPQLLIISKCLIGTKFKNKYYLVEFSILIVQLQFQLYFIERSQQIGIGFAMLVVVTLFALIQIRIIPLRLTIIVSLNLHVQLRFNLAIYDQIILIAIVILQIYMVYTYDNIAHIFSKKNSFQEQLVQTLTTGICILGPDGKRILLQNKQLGQLINSLVSTQKQSRIIKTQTIKEQDDVAIFKNNIKEQFISVEIQYAFQRIFTSRNEFTNQLGILSRQDLSEYIDLRQIIEVLIKLEVKPALLSFKCIYVDIEDDITPLNMGSTNKIIIEVRIQTGFEYEETPCFLVTLYDISTQMESAYYQSLNTFKSKLIKSISHELRTRLNIIQGMIQMSLEEDSIEQIKSLLRNIYNNCRIQAHIIGSIIDYHLIQENQLRNDVESTQVKRVVEEVLNWFKPEAKLKQIKIWIECKIPQQYQLKIDQERLMSVLVQIISNSVKFTPSNGEIQITISMDCLYLQDDSLKQSQQMLKSLEQNSSVAKSPILLTKQLSKQIRSSIKVSQNIVDNFVYNNQKKNCIKISVRDNGIGINQDKLVQINKIVQEHETECQEGSDRSEGFMMGFRVMHQLINYINAKEGNWIKVESVEGAGTTISIYIQTVAKNHRFDSKDVFESMNDEGSVLDIHQMIPNQNFFNFKQQLSLKQASTEACNCNKTIIIADDEPFNLLILESLIKQFDYDVILANDGEQCFNIFKEKLTISQRHNCQGIKAIFMDYQMPILNGEEATKKILALCRAFGAQMVPIIGCTGFSAKQDVRALLDAGMREVFIKPLTKKKIQQALEKLNVVLPNKFTFQEINSPAGIDLEVDEHGQFLEN